MLEKKLICKQTRDDANRRVKLNDTAVKFSLVSAVPEG